MSLRTVITNWKNSPNVRVHFSNIWSDVIGGNCNNLATTIIDKSANVQLSGQPNISQNLLCI